MDSYNSDVNVHAEKDSLVSSFITYVQNIIYYFIYRFVSCTISDQEVYMACII